MTSYSPTTAGNQIWYTWTSTSANTSIDTGQTWTNWAGNSAGTAITSDATWTNWVDSGTSITTYPVWQRWAGMAGSAGCIPLPLTDEQRKARDAQQAEWRKQEEERQKKQKEANERAEVLFKEIVGEELHKLFKSRGFHEAIAPSGTRYRLRPGQLVDQMAGNFGDKVEQRMCIHHNYSEGLPPMDTLIHQMLMIRCGQEDEFVRTANKHRVAA